MLYIASLLGLTVATWIPLWPMLYPRTITVVPPDIMASVPVPNASYDFGGLL